MPHDIAFASLRFSTERLLADGKAGQVPLPASVSTAHPKRRADYIAGRLCAASVAARLAGRAVDVGRLPSGAPCWPTGMTGSISHAHEHAVAVAGPTARHSFLGVDVERLLSPEQTRSLASMILTPGERVRFAAHPSELTATLVFSLKEALFKALHPLTGSMFFHEDAEVVSLEPDGHAALRLLTPLSTEWQTGTTVAARWQCSGSLAFCLVISEQH